MFVYVLFAFSVYEIFLWLQFALFVIVNFVKLDKKFQAYKKMYMCKIYENQYSKRLRLSTFPENCTEQHNPRPSLQIDSGNASTSNNHLTVHLQN